ncbi:MAG: hypothetical protein JO112_14705 [Planctomycetes bacterium]|nr:hypothetical protein [Planctomycetota bacterium]
MWKCLLLISGTLLLTLPALGGGKGDKEVKIQGTLRTGVVAIGGETTGIVLQTKAGTFELEVGRNKQLREKAEHLNGKEVAVTGTLTVRQGVEVKERKIIRVASLKEVEK